VRETERNGGNLREERDSQSVELEFTLNVNRDIHGPAESWMSAIYEDRGLSL
jgi:hypothetical protein